MRGFFVCRWDNFSSDSSFDSGLGSDSDARFDADVPAPEVFGNYLSRFDRRSGLCLPGARFFRQMILAGRRSSDKVPSLLAHSAGTRKQKRPFLCRTAAFLWGKMYVFNIYCCCRIHHPERCGAGLRQKIDADLFNKPMELHGEIRILVAVNQRLNVRFSHNIYM